MVTKARTRTLNAAGEAAKYEREAKKGMKAWKLKHLKPAVQFLTHRAAMSSRLANRPSRGGINEGIQYVQLHNAGDRGYSFPIRVDTPSFTASHRHGFFDNSIHI